MWNHLQWVFNKIFLILKNNFFKNQNTHKLCPTQNPNCTQTHSAPRTHPQMPTYERPSPNQSTWQHTQFLCTFGGIRSRCTRRREGQADSQKKNKIAKRVERSVGGALDLIGSKSAYQLLRSYVMVTEADQWKMEGKSVKAICKFLER